MRFWIRELAGWVLVLLGLYVFLICYMVLTTDGPWLIEAIFFTVIGVVVFRSGIHLLKVAVAARVCLHAQRRLQEQERPCGREKAEGRKRPAGARLRAVSPPGGRGREPA
jgi:hypothetical protein